jgi:hypothetical protein
VVTSATATHRRVLAIGRPLPRAAVVFAGLAAAPAQSGAGSLASPPAPSSVGSPTRSGIGSMLAPPAPSGVSSLLSPEFQLRAIQGLASGSQMYGIAPPSYGDLALTPALSGSSLFGYGWSSVGLPSTLGANAQLPTSIPGVNLTTPSVTAPSPAVTASTPAAPASIPAVAALLNGTLAVGANRSSVRTAGSAGIVGRTAQVGTAGFCSDDQLAMRLQVGATFWTAQGVASAAPVHFPPGVYTGNPSGVGNPLGDAILGPSGDRSNLPPPGPGGGWCRPPPPRFVQSGPLASRAFWTPIALTVAAVFVFWLSRGMKIRG